MINNRKTILGFPVDVFSEEELAAWIEETLQESVPRTIYAVNAEKIMLARKIPGLASILQSADMLIPDGFGPVVGLRLIHGLKVDRVTGVSLMRKLLSLAAKKGHTVFLFGARPEAAARAAENIKRSHPSLKLLGYQHGYIGEDRHPPLLAQINLLKPDILFVGLGSPKQEHWIHLNKYHLKTKICMGVGGSIDVFAGKAALAPVWVSGMYLEWVYRLLRQPSRFERQKKVPLFILNMLKEAVLARIQNGK